MLKQPHTCDVEKVFFPHKDAGKWTFRTRMWWQTRMQKAMQPMKITKWLVHRLYCSCFFCEFNVVVLSPNNFPNKTFVRPFHFKDLAGGRRKHHGFGAFQDSAAADLMSRKGVFMSACRCDFASRLKQEWIRNLQVCNFHICYTEAYCTLKEGEFFNGETCTLYTDECRNSGARVFGNMSSLGRFKMWTV